GKGAGEQARGHRAVDDHPGLVLTGPQQHIIGRVAVDQVERRLDSVDVPYLLGGIELADVVVGQPRRPDLPLAFQVEERLPVVLYRGAVLGGPVHLVQIDPLHVQAAQRRLDLGPRATTARTPPPMTGSCSAATPARTPATRCRHSGSPPSRGKAPPSSRPPTPPTPATPPCCGNATSGCAPCRRRTRTTPD